MDTPYRMNPLVRIALFILVLSLWWWVLDQPLSRPANLFLIVASMLLIIPVSWVGRKLIDMEPALIRTIRITTFVHYTVGGLLGISIFRAVQTHQDWVGWSIPLSPSISLPFVILTGAVAFLSVINLALKGLGAPFAIALSEKLAAEWLYAWTRNPMVLGTIVFLVVLGVWYQSVLFVLWALFLFTPALLFFVKVYEERELEIRFGAPYLAYKARTPLLIPRRPKR